MKTNMWFLKGLKRHGRTERFPKKEPDEVADWSTEISGSGKVNCPTQAIVDDKWVSGKCIYCRLCSPKYVPTGKASISKVNKTIPPVGFKPFGRSLYIYVVDSGTCGACNMELQAISTPNYDMNRLGLFFTNSPRHADAIAIMGIHSEKMAAVLDKAYEAMPAPKLIIAIGACAISGGIMGKSPSISRDAIVSIPGCPPNPYTILDGIIKAKEAASK